MNRPRPAQLLLVLPGIVAGSAAAIREVKLSNPGGLLTATSILTGLAFSMATTFWSKSIDARRRPDQALNVDVLRALDAARTHLIWTVCVGVVATALLAVVAVFWSQGGPVWLSAVTVGVVFYMLTLVAGAVHRFYVAAFILR